MHKTLSTPQRLSAPTFILHCDDCGKAFRSTYPKAKFCGNCPVPITHNGLCINCGRVADAGVVCKWCKEVA
jgi:hypothetical protein